MLSKSNIWQMISFIFLLFITTVGGVAYIHANFETTVHAKETKDDLKGQLNRIEDKIDKTWNGPKRKQMEQE